MRKNLTSVVILSLFTLMFMPAYADVSSLSLTKGFYTVDEKIVFEGIESTGNKSVYVIIRDSSGGFVDMASDPSSDGDGMFSTLPRDVDVIFDRKGIYNATAFTDEQKEKEGFSIKLEFDGDKVFEASDFVLQLKSISDKTIEEEKTLTFTAKLTETVEDVIFSLDKNSPTGATINSKTGKFIWTPTKSQGPDSYEFDIVVTKDAQVDYETIKITVSEIGGPTIQPDTTPKPKSTELEPKPKELEIPAPFVDVTKDPQSYVDRYNNEESYKKWFDDNYPEYSSIYEAVGLEEPVEIPDFIDPNQDTQYYIDRYNNEPKYKKWFDNNYPDITIYQAVGEEPTETEKSVGECGKGTILVDGVCVPEKSPAEKTGGGCLIATAAYGSEMAPQVQFLREIRDGKVMATESGASFMAGFNEFYYSFSPYIADYERENPIFREMVKIGMTPMLSTLSVMSMADSEQEVLAYGIGVILMNIGMYVAIPALLIYKTRKLIRI